MNGKALLLLFVLIDFVAFTAYVVYTNGYLQFIYSALTDLYTIQIALDLIIALALVLVWMVLDARKRGVTVWPFVIATCFLGSISPLAYLFLREWKRTNLD